MIWIFLRTLLIGSISALSLLSIKAYGGGPEKENSRLLAATAVVGALNTANTIIGELVNRRGGSDDGANVPGPNNGQENRSSPDGDGNGQPTVISHSHDIPDFSIEDTSETSDAILFLQTLERIINHWGYIVGTRQEQETVAAQVHLESFHKTPSDFDASRSRFLNCANTIQNKAQSKQQFVKMYNNILLSLLNLVLSEVAPSSQEHAFYNRLARKVISNLVSGDHPPTRINTIAIIKLLKLRLAQWAQMPNHLRYSPEMIVESLGLRGWMEGLDEILTRCNQRNEIFQKNIQKAITNKAVANQALLNFERTSSWLLSNDIFYVKYLFNQLIRLFEMHNLPLPQFENYHPESRAPILRSQELDRALHDRVLPIEPSSFIQGDRWQNYIFQEQDNTLIRYQEYILPGRNDNNCAIYAIYGRPDITRLEVVRQLLDEDNGCNELIRRLVAEDILTYLMAVDDENINTVLENIFPSDTHRDILSYLKIYRKSGMSADMFRRIVEKLQRVEIFEAYVRNFVGGHINNDFRDAYNMLHYNRQPLGEPAIGNVITAIAAMHGLGVRIYQRIDPNQNALSLVYEYVPQGANRIIHLLHTTADSENALGALNHFNLLIESGGGSMPESAEIVSQPLVFEEKNKEPQEQQSDTVTKNSLLAAKPEHMVEEESEARNVNKAEDKAKAQDGTVEEDDGNYYADWLKAVEQEREYTQRRRREIAQEHFQLYLERIESFIQPLNRILALTLDETQQFQIFLEHYFKQHQDERDLWNNFINGNDNQLTSDDIDKLACIIAKRLENFLKSLSNHSRTGRFTDEAIDAFIKEFLENHKNTYHYWHKWSTKLLPGDWVKLRHAPWIWMGIIEVEADSRLDRRRFERKMAEETLKKQQSAQGGKKGRGRGSRK